MLPDIDPRISQGPDIGFNDVQCLGTQSRPHLAFLLCEMRVRCIYLLNVRSLYSLIHETPSRGRRDLLILCRSHLQKGVAGPTLRSQGCAACPPPSPPIRLVFRLTKSLAFASDVLRPRRNLLRGIV